jgi:O-antigen/teichoic acid export membrane protein
VSAPGQDDTWHATRGSQLHTIARNVSTRYLVIFAEMAVGLVMLPFNLAHLGKEQYGLWVLLGSLTVHFSTLELGLGSGLVKFAARYRALRDPRALNEIASTLFWIFTGMAVLSYAIVIGVAVNLEHIFAVTPEQAAVGQWILLIIGVYIAMHFPFGIYGGIIAGFQRYDVNNTMSVVVTFVAAGVNAAVLLAGGGLVTLVAATTFVRVAGYFVYRRNAFRVFPALHISPAHFRLSRLREVTGFSIYASIIDWAHKLNYQIDQLVIGMFLGTGAVAVWAPAERIVFGVQRMTNQLNSVLFPTVVDNDASDRRERLQEILLQGTRLSLVMVAPIAATLIVLADPLVHAWLGNQAAAVAGCIPVIQVLSVSVAIRVGGATGNTILKGAGEHRLLAWVNLGSGVINVLLSVLLVRRFGIVGVAWGTLLPLSSASIFILFPAACRRVGVPLGRALRESVFPAAWPAFAVGAVLTFTRGISSGTLLAVALQTAAGCVLYLALFFVVAINREDRAYYIAKVSQLTRRGPVVPAGSV